MHDGLLYDESKMLLEVALGNQKAFTLLVDTYWNQVYSHSLAYTKSSRQAQEITQDVFLKVWNKRENLKDVSNFKNYLFILGRNHIITAVRKKLDQLVEYDMLDASEDMLVPDQQLEHKETWNKILEGIEKLPPARKAVFKMSRLEGLSYEDIATKLNISKNTVKEHIILSLNFLRTYLHLHRHLISLFILLLQNFKK
jgi:RNA polymerase sigma-70 factor (ECF subfamily)